MNQKAWWMDGQMNNLTAICPWGHKNMTMCQRYRLWKQPQWSCGSEFQLFIIATCKTALITYVNSESSDKPAHLHLQTCQNLNLMLAHCVDLTKPIHEPAISFVNYDVYCNTCMTSYLNLEEFVKPKVKKKKHTQNDTPWSTYTFGESDQFLLDSLRVASSSGQQMHRLIQIHCMHLFCMFCFDPPKIIAFKEKCHFQE